MPSHGMQHSCVPIIMKNLLELKGQKILFAQNINDIMSMGKVVLTAQILALVISYYMDVSPTSVCLYLSLLLLGIQRVLSWRSSSSCRHSAALTGTWRIPSRKFSLT